MQAFLTIEPHIAQNKRQELTELIITSFCSESHQFCVKQIMQWLLIRLLCNNKNSLTVIKDSLNSADRTRVSSITAFVPVLYHLTTNIDCEEVIDVILPWTMGAHFKLRLYAQVRKQFNVLTHKQLIYCRLQFVNCTNKHKEETIKYPYQNYSICTTRYRQL